MASVYTRDHVLPKDRHLSGTDPRGLSCPISTHSPPGCRPALLAPAKMPAPTRSLSPAAFPTSSLVTSSPVPGFLTSLPFLSGKRQKVKAANSSIMSFPNVGCHLPTCTSPSPLLSRARKTGSKVPIKRNHSEELPGPVL